MSDTTIPPHRRCTKCGVEYPATTEYFYTRKSTKSGMRSECKPCSRKEVAEWAEQNRERKRESSREWRRMNHDKACRQAREWQVNHPERCKEHGATYRKRHSETHRARARRWQEQNPERNRLRCRTWCRNNREAVREKGRIYRKLHPERIRVVGHRYRARKRSLPDTLTQAQWQQAVEYFHGCCAVCGRQTNDLFKTHHLAADHWIPLSSPGCPGTVAGNIIPLCHGLDGCNNSKHDKHAEAWLVEKYGKRKAVEIINRINEYFTSLKQETNET